MLHRYGRHGPQAWLRRWQRRYWRPPPPTPAREERQALPAVKSQQLANVRVWQLTERIIVIMIDSNFQDEPEALGPVNLSHLPEISDSGIPSTLHNRLCLRAAQELRRLAQETATYHRYFYLNLPALRWQADRIATEELGKSIPETKLSTKDYLALQENATDFYVREFTNSVRSERYNAIFVNEEQYVLAKRAKEERDRYLAARDSHQRDLAVIAVLQILGLKYDQKLSNDQIEQIHREADWYERVIHEDIEIIEWPPAEGPFRHEHSHDMGD
jgi:hypothetical protein